MPPIPDPSDLTPIWSEQDYVRFSRHPETAVRSWATRRLIRFHPDSAGEAIDAALSSPSHLFQHSQQRKIYSHFPLLG